MAFIPIPQSPGEGLIPFLLHSRNGRLVSTFGIFVAVQFLFARIYFYLYNRRRQNFSFNSDILQNQSSVVGAALKDRLSRFQSAIDAMKELAGELDGGAEPIADQKGKHMFRLPSGRKCVSSFVSHGRTGAWVLDILDSDDSLLTRQNPGPETFVGAMVGGFFGRPLVTAAEWKQALPDVTARLNKAEQAQIRRLETLTMSSPDVWSYWDFLYFSTILQTTVGFGDVLPNSTAVRMIVVAQILVGYALLVVVLNIVLGT